MAQINEGDTVRLKSGGPLMTVIKVTGDSVAVVWFDKNQNERRGVFIAKTLDKDDGGPIIA